MTAPATLIRSGAAEAPGTGTYLSAPVHRTFAERTEPLLQWDVRGVPTSGLADLYGVAGDPESLSGRTGNGFIAMSESLLTACADTIVADIDCGQEPVDAVILAYRWPDLFVSDVAGFYLSDRLPGDPPAWSVQSDVGASFTALRIVDRLRAAGELSRGAVFVYDQNAAAAPEQPDSAALLVLGAEGGPNDAVVGDIAVTPALEDPDGVMAIIHQRHPDDRVIRSSGGTAGWAAVAADWPVRTPILLVEHDETADLLHTCRIKPE